MKTPALVMFALYFCLMHSSFGSETRTIEDYRKAIRTSDTRPLYSGDRTFPKLPVKSQECQRVGIEIFEEIARLWSQPQREKKTEGSELASTTADWMDAAHQALPLGDPSTTCQTQRDIFRTLAIDIRSRF